MTDRNSLAAHPFPQGSLCRPLLIGAGIALALMSIFLLTFFLSEGTPNPAWPELWWIRPLAVITNAGAAGGIFYYIMDRMMGSKGGWRKAVAIVLSVIVYIIGLWMGTVLGLVGTMWH